MLESRPGIGYRVKARVWTKAKVRIKARVRVKLG